VNSDAAVAAMTKAYSDGVGVVPNDAWVRRLLEAAAPHMAAQALRDAVDAFPLETISAPDTAVAWLMRRADELDQP